MLRCLYVSDGVSDSVCDAPVREKLSFLKSKCKIGDNGLHIIQSQKVEEGEKEGVACELKS